MDYVEKENTLIKYDYSEVLCLYMGTFFKGAKRREGGTFFDNFLCDIGHFQRFHISAKTL